MTDASGVGRRVRPAPPRLGPWLYGHLLVAVPGRVDPEMADAVVFVCSHADEGAMGVLLNRSSTHPDLTSVLRELKMVDEAASLERARSTPVVRGGPCDATRGFLLHSSEYGGDDDTLDVDDGVKMSFSLNALHAIAAGAGPRKAVLALGCVHWKPGILESEIRDNGWMVLAGDEEILFGGDVGSKYARALRLLGIRDRNDLSAVGGVA